MISTTIAICIIVFGLYKLVDYYFDKKEQEEDEQKQCKIEIYSDKKCGKSTSFKELRKK